MTQGLCGKVSLGAFAILVAGLCAAPAGAQEGDIDFTHDIRPLLSNNCFACHGPDEEARKADLRLDIAEEALDYAIVSGSAEDSELFLRIASDDPDVHMPPADSNKTLTEEEVDLIRRWIDAGAQWDEHWAFVSPVRPELPEVSNADWCRTPIDYFVLSRLDREELGPAAEADKETLIRRVTFDLTGLPPTLEEIDAFLADNSPDAYVRLVDRLLASPRYGEHMARFWLDAARYGDTHGLHLDNYREMWPYRDWVVRAFNDNKPFDQFATEQLAGDLLPGATLDQRVASGFNRCHVTTGEGGSIVEEVYVRNVNDRVVTTATVFMATTFECTRCHDHKYDPYTMRDFYSMFAFFNNLNGPAMDGNAKAHAPVLQVPGSGDEEELAQLGAQVVQAEQEISQVLATIEYVDPMTPDEVEPLSAEDVVWIEDEPPAGAKLFGWNTTTAPNPVFSGEKSLTLTATGREQHVLQEATDTLVITEGDVLFAYVYLDPESLPRQIMLQWRIDGSWEHRAYWGESLIEWGAEGTVSRHSMGDLPTAAGWVRLEVPAEKVGLAPGAQVNGWAFTQFDGTVYWDKAGVTTFVPRVEYESFAEWHSHQEMRIHPTLPDEIASVLSIAADERTEEQQDKLFDFFLTEVYPTTRNRLAESKEQIATANQRIDEIRSSWPTTLVFSERPDLKPSYILLRGEYDDPGEEVPRAIPTVLPPMPEGAPLNRLGFAQWLLQPDHPLTARVQVNRYWQNLLGTGIVKTSEDFGSQGEPPSHPELLDWLAVQFVEGGWDVKDMMRTIVMSSTYRQSSRMTPEMIARDPENRLLARGPRYRLDAEMIRDQALAVSGLLVNQLGGPSVKPPQPDGLWFAVGYSGSDTVRFQADTGPERIHRRTLYTFIKRTAPPPQLGMLDGPSRETCTVRRERTNTPLQALMLMNDPQFVEAARALAGRTMREGGDTPESKADYLYRLCAGRHADDFRIAEELSLYRDLLAAFEANPAAAQELINVGPLNPDDAMEAAELASWTMVASMVMNLDEVLSKN